MEVSWHIWIIPASLLAMALLGHFVGWVKAQTETEYADDLADLMKTKLKYESEGDAGFIRHSLGKLFIPPGI